MVTVEVLDGMKILSGRKREKERGREREREPENY